MSQQDQPSSPSSANKAVQPAGRSDSSEARRVSPFPTRDPRAGAPARPSLTDKGSAPVLVKLPPPFFVRLSQFFWIISLVAGAAAIVYSFVIRQAQLPEIADLVRGVDETRVDETYTAAADIIFWCVFAGLIITVLAQLGFQVSFAGRRPNVRWWLLGSVLFQGIVFLVARELLAFGERGLPLERILLIQLGLAVLGLLAGVMPPALKWTARKHDVKRGPQGPSTPDL